MPGRYHEYVCHQSMELSCTVEMRNRDCYATGKTCGQVDQKENEIFVASGASGGLQGLKRANKQMLTNAEKTSGKLAAIQTSETYVIDVGIFLAVRAKFQCQ